MISLLRKSNKFNVFILISLISCFAISLLIFRIYKTNSMHFVFLIWNLFLAGIPFVISTLLIIYPKMMKRLIIVIPAGIVWLLFLPNAFYILTDLFHLNYNNLAPIWYDLILIFSFAWAGILLGFSGLNDLEKILNEKINKKIVPFISSSLLFVISFGIYLGRILRWNSWNIINEPTELLKDISVRIINPAEHQGTWGMTILTGILLNFIWLSFKLLKTNNLKPITKS